MITYFICLDTNCSHLSNPCEKQVDLKHVMKSICKLDLHIFHPEIGECFKSAAFEALENLVEVCIRNF